MQWKWTVGEIDHLVTIDQQERKIRYQQYQNVRPHMGGLTTYTYESYMKKRGKNNAVFNNASVSLEDRIAEAVLSLINTENGKDNPST